MIPPTSSCISLLKTSRRKTWGAWDVFTDFLKVKRPPEIGKKNLTGNWQVLKIKKAAGCGYGENKNESLHSPDGF